jgi:hypothetical protein
VKRLSTFCKSEDARLFPSVFLCACPCPTNCRKTNRTSFYPRPVAWYLNLLEEYDLGSHRDHIGLLSLLEACALVPAGGEEAAWDFAQSSQRVPMTTMVYSLLELWPGSLALGASLFRALFSKKYNDQGKQVGLAVNIMMRVLAGGARSTCAIDMRKASRLLGNLLNGNESSTRLALKREVAHLCAIDSKELPGQLQQFLQYISQLTFERRDRRLNMVVLLQSVLNDHMACVPSPKASLPALSLILSILPIPIAISTAEDLMLESSNSHLRVAVLKALVGAWKRRVEAKNDRSDTEHEKFWGLLILLLEQDRVEAVRLAVIDHMESAAKHLLELQDQNENTALVDTLPPEVILALCKKCADISPKCQARAMGVLCRHPEGAAEPPDTLIGDTVRCPALLSALEHSTQTTRRDVGLLLCAISETAAANPDAFHVDVKSRLSDLLPSLEITPHDGEDDYDDIVRS